MSRLDCSSVRESVAAQVQCQRRMAVAAAFPGDRMGAPCGALLGRAGDRLVTVQDAAHRPAGQTRAGGRGERAAPCPLGRSVRSGASGDDRAVSGARRGEAAREATKRPMVRVSPAARHAAPVRRAHRRDGAMRKARSKHVVVAGAYRRHRALIHTNRKRRIWRLPNEVPGRPQDARQAKSLSTKIRLHTLGAARPRCRSAATPLHGGPGHAGAPFAGRARSGGILIPRTEGSAAFRRPGRPATMRPWSEHAESSLAGKHPLVRGIDLSKRSRLRHGTDPGEGGKPERFFGVARW